VNEAYRGALSPELTAALFEHAPDPILITDANGDVVDANPAALDLLGYEREELLQLRARDIVVAGPGWAARESAHNHCAGHWEGRVEVRIKDGRTVPLETHSVVIPGPAGVLFADYHRDVTDRKRSETAQAHLAAIIESSEDAIIGKTLDGTITSWNPAAERLYGYTAEEAVGRSITMLIPPGGPNDVPELLSKIGRGERVARYDARRQTKDGRLLDISLTISPVRDSQGTIVGASVNARDITAMRRLQAEHDRLYAEREAEIQRAAEIQSQLIPRSAPELAGYQFAGACLPSLQVGGDFFDWSSTNEGVRLSLGDVMGKGVGASLLMATVRSALRAVTNLPASETVRAVNRALYADLAESASFVSLFHANLDTATGVLTYIDAGHGMAFLHRRDDGVELLNRGELVLGALPDVEYSEGATTLEPGDSLVLYSDGLVEARPELRLDPEGVAGQLQGLDQAQAKVDQLVRLAGEAGSRPDDLTLVVVQHVGQ
jgi:PAS domain S-box-containing protein